MLNENAKKLVAALRSGEFKQGRDCLRKKETFCCLGVACELAAREGIIPPAHSSGFGIFRYGYECNYLPEAVQKWIGFTERTGMFLGDGLALMNDRGDTFDAIADKIESEPFCLFAE